MVKITATGKIADTTVSIIVVSEDGKTSVEADELLKQRLNIYMDKIPRMAGTFIPDKGSVLAYYSIFTLSDFFSKPPKVEIDGELPTLPHEYETIY